LASILGVVSPLSDVEVQLALDQYGGAVYGSTATANLQHTSYYLSQFAGRFRARMNPGDPLSSSGYAVAEPVDAGELMLVNFQSDAGRALCSPTRCAPTRRAWVSGYGLGGSADGDGNADGFDYGLGGTQFAVEHAFAKNWSGGMWGNMAWGQVEGDTLDETAKLENYHFGGHLIGFDGCDYWIGMAGFGYNKAEIRRTITAGTNATADGDMDGLQTNLYLERGRSLCLGGYNLQPFAALQYVYLHQGSLTESGAGPVNLVVGSLDAHSLRSIVGGRLATSRTTRSGRLLTPELHASWMHEFLDTNQVVSSTFAGTSATFAVSGVDLGRDWANLGAGATLQLNHHARVYGGYDVQVNENQAMHVGSGGVEFVW